MNAKPFNAPRQLRTGFTLVEIMVSLAVLTILLMISAQVIGQVQSTWSASNARVSQFREARTAFDILTRNLGQATLNTYIDYDTNYLASAGAAAATTAPGSYVRRSDLHFVCGRASDLVQGGDSMLPGHAVFFQAPLGVSNTPAYVGLDKLLCARGYFVQFSSDESWAPRFIQNRQSKFRYRLMEFSPPTELNTMYAASATVASNPRAPIPRTWFARAGAAATGNAAQQAAALLTRPVADNIVALIISPRREPQVANEAESASGPTQIAPAYAYDSSAIVNPSNDSPQGTQHLLPPMVRVVLIAIDEKSADMLDQQAGGGGTPPLGSDIDTQLTQAHNLETEVNTITTLLQQRKVNYRVFSATIQLRGAKWSI
jgi:uncharacterized protein (TIGR02599 family)